MSDKKISNMYDDGNIPDIDMSKNTVDSFGKPDYNVEPLPESTRPRKDGPGGDEGEQ